MRRHLTRSGFRRLTGVKVDDLFVYTDGDELILPEILVRILKDSTITFVCFFKIVLDLISYEKVNYLKSVQKV